MKQQRQSVKAVFDEAVEIASPAERQAYLDRACAEDPGVRSNVEALLRAYEAAGNFLENSAATVPEHPITEGPGAVIGPYKLLQQLGEGGMGAVFMAEQTQPVQRKVALKVIKPGMDSRQVLARFEAERQALALMDHPNIARVLDAGATESGLPYFVMELVKGVPITRYCDERRLTPRQRLELFVPVCRAVQHAHQKGIIHRDLKPSNVLVALYDGQPVPKVIDFGVAKATGPKLTERTLFTEFGQVVGTLEYMSPEQAELNQLDVDTRSDVYSLGVLLYELLTGTTPLGHGRLREAPLLEVLRLIREEEPPRPSTRLSTAEHLPSIAASRGVEPRKLSGLVRGELDWVVMKCLEKDRDRRYETATGLAGDIERYLADEPVQACPPSAWYRFRKLARRNKGALAAAVAAALVVLLAGVGLGISNVLISRERDEKVTALEQARLNEEAANQQRGEAQENLKDALAAVDRMLTRVSEERLQEVPHGEPLRRDLLQDALEFYQRFLARKGGDPAIRRETALAYRRMGSIYFELGRCVEAEEAYRKAFAMLDELHAESPLEPRMLGELVSYYIGFSWVLANRGKYEEQEEALRHGVAVAEDLFQKFPEDPWYRNCLIDANNRLAGVIAGAKPEEAETVLHRNLTLMEGTNSFWHRAQTYQNLGILLAKQRRFPEAVDSCREAIRLFDKEAAESPARRQREVDLADTLRQLAEALEADGRLPEAEAVYRRAIPVLDKLAADFPAGPFNRWAQAAVAFKYASLLRKLQRPAEAERGYRRSLELFDKLANDFPALPGYRETAFEHRLAFARFLAEAGRAPEAQQTLGEADALLGKLPPLKRAQALKARGHFYGESGEWDKAAADFTQAVGLGSDDVLGVWAPLAVLHLRAGRGDEYRSLCARLLERFGQTDNPWVAATCCLAPMAVANLSRPVRIAERRAGQEPRRADDLAILGMALYRQGDSEGAIRRLEASIRSDPGPFDVHGPKLALAMAYHRLGRGAEARQLLQEVTRWMEEHIEGKRGEAARAAVPLPWFYRESLQLLRREAEETLKQDSGGDRPGLGERQGKKE